MLRGFESHRSHTYINTAFEVLVVTSVAKTATDSVDSAPMVKRYHTDLVSQKRRIVTCLGHQTKCPCGETGNPRTCEGLVTGSSPAEDTKNFRRIASKVLKQS